MLFVMTVTGIRVLGRPGVVRPGVGRVLHYCFHLPTRVLLPNDWCTSLPFPHVCNVVSTDLVKRRDTHQHCMHGGRRGRGPSGGGFGIKYLIHPIQGVHAG